MLTKDNNHTQTVPHFQNAHHPQNITQLIKARERLNGRRRENGRLADAEVTQGRDYDGRDMRPRFGRYQCEHEDRMNLLYCCVPNVLILFIDSWNQESRP